ncbi:glycosyltransferase family 2 protein [Chamaesiphon sp. OTE_75_metabat_556]|uniref:glycosyltransferase family 2 protein n=1 Tax=Chamaesiphon sp. OTE_75_metabat_556 TaxID=2964692 RepID=UPI00286C6B3F|nr:glycosyltransferase family 2 protein [Chamaesiphon sp. OTE_75_metabat_556]
MIASHPYRSQIATVPAGGSRPLWSVMIPTYNCANYLQETLTSVLAQDPGRELMQIEVVDDCSTQDDPEAIVKGLAGDRVSFYRQPQNVGHIQNFDTCLQRSHGRLIHLLHGDDLVMPGFYNKLQTGFDQHPEIGAAFSRHVFIDELSNWTKLSDLEQTHSGILTNWLEKIAVRQLIQTPSIVVRREVYERWGGFDRRMKCWGEDWEMWVRIAAQYPVWYESQPLAQYRQRSTSLTGNTIRTGENIQDIRQAIEIVKEYLPASTAASLNRNALQNYANYALSTADSFIKAKDRTAAIAQIRAAIACHFSLSTIPMLLKLSLKAVNREISSKLALARSTNL